jgi:hypothetical protein
MDSNASNTVFGFGMSNFSNSTKTDKTKPTKGFTLSFLSNPGQDRSVSSSSSVPVFGNSTNKTADSKPTKGFTLSSLSNPEQDSSVSSSASAPVFGNHESNFGSKLFTGLTSQQQEDERWKKQINGYKFISGDVADSYDEEIMQSVMSNEYINSNIRLTDLDMGEEKLLIARSNFIHPYTEWFTNERDYTDVFILDVSSVGRTIFALNHTQGELTFYKKLLYLFEKLISFDIYDEVVEFGYYMFVLNGITSASSAVKGFHVDYLGRIDWLHQNLERIVKNSSYIVQKEETYEPEVNEYDNYFNNLKRITHRNKSTFVFLEYSSHCSSVTIYEPYDNNSNEIKFEHEDFNKSVNNHGIIRFPVCIGSTVLIRNDKYPHSTPFICKMPEESGERRSTTRSLSRDRRSRDRSTSRDSRSRSRDRRRSRSRDRSRDRSRSRSRSRESRTRKNRTESRSERLDIINPDRTSGNIIMDKSARENIRRKMARINCTKLQGSTMSNLLKETYSALYPTSPLKTFNLEKTSRETIEILKNTIQTATPPESTLTTIIRDVVVQPVNWDINMNVVTYMCDPLREKVEHGGGNRKLF